MTIEYDAADDAVPEASAAEVKARLHAAGHKALKLEHRIDRLDDIKAAMSADHQQLVRHELPELMAQIGVNALEGDGLKIKIGTKVHGTLNRAPDIEAAIDHLVAEGFQGAVLTTLIVEFSEAEKDDAEKIAAMMADSLHRDVKVQRGVNPQTLAKWVREQLAAGKHVPLEVLGCAAWREATVKEG